jgi:hypothetical protein
VPPNEIKKIKTQKAFSRKDAKAQRRKGAKEKQKKLLPACVTCSCNCATEENLKHIPPFTYRIIAEVLPLLSA